MSLGLDKGDSERIPLFRVVDEGPTLSETPISCELNRTS